MLKKIKPAYRTSYSKKMLFKKMLFVSAIFFFLMDTQQSLLASELGSDGQYNVPAYGRANVTLIDPTIMKKMIPSPSTHRDQEDTQGAILGNQKQSLTMDKLHIDPTEHMHEEVQCGAIQDLCNILNADEEYSLIRFLKDWREANPSSRLPFNNATAEEQAEYNQFMDQYNTAYNAAIAENPTHDVYFPTSLEHLLSKEYHCNIQDIRFTFNGKSKHGSKVYVVGAYPWSNKEETPNTCVVSMDKLNERIANNITEMTRKQNLSLSTLKADFGKKGLMNVYKIVFLDEAIVS